MWSAGARFALPSHWVGLPRWRSYPSYSNRWPALSSVGGSERTYVAWGRFRSCLSEGHGAIGCGAIRTFRTSGAERIAGSWVGGGGIGSAAPWLGANGPLQHRNHDGRTIGSLVKVNQMRPCAGPTRPFPCLRARRESPPTPPLETPSWMFRDGCELGAPCVPGIPIRFRQVVFGRTKRSLREGALDSSASVRFACDMPRHIVLRRNPYARSGGRQRAQYPT